MSNLSIHVACSPGEQRIAVVRDEVLLDYALWRPGAPDGLDDLHRGRVQQAVPALGGAFVLLQDGVTGFLPRPDKAPPLCQGDPVLARIARSAQGGKGPRLALAKAEEGQAFPLQGPPVLLRRAPGPLRDWLRQHAAAPVLVDDPALAAALAPECPPPRLRLVDTAFAEPVAAQVDALAATELALPGGMRASIHPTPALVAIDMDTAAASRPGASKQQAQFAANRTALPALLHQLRLRNLSGAILVDLAGLPSRKRQALAPEIAAALALDPAGPRLLGFTALGLAEIQRPRLRPPLHELLSGPHAAAIDALRHALAHAIARPGQPPRLHAGLGVHAVLERDTAAREAFGRRAGQPIAIRLDPALPELGWRFDHASGAIALP